VSPPPNEATPGAGDPFALLGLPRRLALDPSAIRAAYRTRAAAVHPDRTADPAERAELARRSAALGEAQRQLLEPIRRAEAILVALGAATGSAADPPPGEFLMEMLELREELAAAGGGPARAELRRGVAERIAEIRDRLAATFETAESRPAAERAPLLRLARNELAAWRYLDRLLVADGEDVAP